MSLTMKHENRRYCHRCHRQFINIFMLSIIWIIMFTETVARPHLETLSSSKHANDVLEQPQQQQLQQKHKHQHLLAAEKSFNKLQKHHHHHQPYLFNKWPGLRDLVLTLDYEDNNGLEENNELLNKNFFERLRQLASPKSDTYDDGIRFSNVDTNNGLVPSKSLKSYTSLSSNQLSFKDHNIKKNVHYMSPCHFKICNMGRKRDAHVF